MLAGLFGTPLASFKPNRLMPGEPAYLFDMASRGQIFLIFFLIVLSVFFSFLIKRSYHFKLPLCICLSGLLYVLLYVSGGAAMARALDNYIFRTGFNTGFWLFIIGYVMAMSQAFMTVSNDRADIKIIIVILVFAPVVAVSFYEGIYEIAFVKELIAKQDRFLLELKNHIIITFSSVSLAIIMGVPLGIFAFRHNLASEKIFGVLNIVQTIPSVALFGFLVVPFGWLSAQSELLRGIGFAGIGWAPAIAALVLYSLLPIVRNVYAAISSIDDSIILSARGSGMTHFQVLTKVQLPISMPLIMNGVRVSLVQCIGNTAVAALVGAGGLGLFIFQGLGQSAPDMILMGAVPTILMAVLADSVMLFCIKLSSPKGMSYDQN